MIAAFRLGLRLAIGTTGQRGRSLLTAVAAGIGTLALLLVLAMVATAQLRTWFGDTPEFVRLQAVIVFGVALPVLALAATVGRLSASLRDRRLANLRLLGLTAAQTRLMAAVESGVSAVAGSVLGVLAFWLLRLVPGTWSVAGLEWRGADLRPSVAAYALAVAAVPLAVTAVSSLPQRLDTRRALERARKADARRPSWWRIVPLLVGVGLSLRSWDANVDFQLTNTEVALLFAGIGLTGIGLLLVVPVFVRMIADLMLRAARTPSTLIAARRLQAQPAGVTRVISALMIGLFLVVGSRGVVAAFESTPQYLIAEAQVATRQWAVVVADPGKTAGQTRQARAVTGVRDVVTLPWLTAQRGSRYRPARGAQDTVVVGTCADLTRLAPAVTGCVDGEPLWLYPQGDGRMPRRITVAPASDNESRNGVGATITVEPGSRYAGLVPGSPSHEVALGPIDATLLLPPGTPGVAPVLAEAQHRTYVVAGPGRTLVDDLLSAGVPVHSFYGFEDYDFVAGLRAIVYSLAALILGLGLLTFGIAAIDRALGRRRELASLQVLGTPPGVLQRAQWLEAAAPTVTGTLLAIGAGWFAGVTFLRLDGSSSQALDRVLPATITIAVAALVISVLVAGLTVIASNTRLTSDQIRSE